MNGLLTTGWSPALAKFARLNRSVEAVKRIEKEIERLKEF